MRNATTFEELIAFTAYKERLRHDDLIAQQRKPHVMALFHQKKLLAEIMAEEHSPPSDQHARINSRKKYALQAAIARTEIALKDIG